MSITGDLVEQVLNVNYRTFTPKLQEACVAVTLDGLGVMLAGANEPTGIGDRIRTYVNSVGGTPEATVAGGVRRTSCVNAAFANGTMAHALDFDNFDDPPNHPMSPTLPVLLALGEREHFGGSRWMEALVASFEVQGRLRRAATGLKTGKGFHKPGTIGLMGAAAAAVRLLELDADQAIAAFGIAASRAGSLAVNTGTMTKSSHSGHAARMGLESALLAQLGWTASDDVMGPGGFMDAFMPGDYAIDKLLEDFGDPYLLEVPGTGFKKYPSNGFTQRPIDGVLKIRRDAALKADDVRKIDVVMPPFDYVNRPAPETGLEGKFSVQYVVAVALLDGAVSVRSFSDERRFSPDVVELLPRITVRYDPEVPLDPRLTSARLVVETVDEDVVETTVTDLTGMVGIPLLREELVTKYLSCAGLTLDSEQSEALMDRVFRLSDLDDTSILGQSIGGDDRR
jgi:aconitate decarboxylase